MQSRCESPGLACASVAKAVSLPVSNDARIDSDCFWHLHASAGEVCSLLLSLLYCTHLASAPDLPRASQTARRSYRLASVSNRSERSLSKPMLHILLGENHYIDISRFSRIFSEPDMQNNTIKATKMQGRFGWNFHGNYTRMSRACE
jgi:hypothetical protein